MFHRVLKGVGWALGALAGFALGAGVAGFALLWYLSPGTPQPFVDANGQAVAGSISTIERVTLGGAEQALIIRGRDAGAPVMLFLHGGPGSPEYPMLRQTNPGLEDDFVMVYWQQRGAGMSFDAALDPATMTLAQMVADTAELAALLARRFDREKVFLMGHSWGTLLGLTTVKAHPELFHAYFGVGNVGYQMEGERLSLAWARQRAAETGDARAVAALAALQVPDADAGAAAWGAYMRVQRPRLDALGGGMMHDSPGLPAILKWVLVTPEYRLRDKLNYGRGLVFSQEHLWQEVVSTNLIETTGRVDVPVWFLQGAWDYQTPTPLARALFERIKAPMKEFVLFGASAHSPLMEEPGKFNALVRAAASEME